MNVTAKVMEGRSLDEDTGMALSKTSLVLQVEKVELENQQFH